MLDVVVPGQVTGFTIPTAQVMDEKHRKIITSRSVTHKKGNMLLDIIQMRLGALPSAKGFVHSRFAELLMGSIFRFGETVRIQENGVIAPQKDFLLSSLAPFSSDEKLTITMADGAPLPLTSPIQKNNFSSRTK